MLREDCGAPNDVLGGIPRTQDRATETRAELASPQVEGATTSIQASQTRTLPISFKQRQNVGLTNKVKERCSQNLHAW
eukprot:c14517_g1_i3 orf=600-833(-)